MAKETELTIGELEGYEGNVRLCINKMLDALETGDWYDHVPTIATAKLLSYFLASEDSLQDAIDMLDMYHNLIREHLEKKYQEWQN